MFCSVNLSRIWGFHNLNTWYDENIQSIWGNLCTRGTRLKTHSTTWPQSSAKFFLVEKYSKDSDISVSTNKTLKITIKTTKKENKRKKKIWIWASLWKSCTQTEEEQDHLACYLCTDQKHTYRIAWAVCTYVKTALLLNYIEALWRKKA